MPRNARNFWIEVTIDGRTSRIAAGPQRKNGGFEFRILQRTKGGNIAEVIDGWGIAHDDGRLALRVRHGVDKEDGARVDTSEFLTDRLIKIESER